MAAKKKRDKVPAGDKRGMASFGTIVATIGSILIACGFAWLIASNWHQIPDAVKVLLLVVLTIASFTAGVLFKTHEHRGVGHALLILGALLYILSIFLIAQIFDFCNSLQCVAWLFFLCWVGTIITAYLFDSPANLVIGISEFVIWLEIQFGVMFEGLSVSVSSLGLFMLLFLAAGVLLYGLSLLHKSSNHKFSKVYEWWTAFYFLVFAYIMTFQITLPLLWPQGLQFATSPVLFLVIFGFLALVAIVSGAFVAYNRQKLSSRELLGVAGAVLLLFFVITSGLIVSSGMGSCSPKYCYEIRNENACEQSNLPGMQCSWSKEYNSCDTKSCINLESESECIAGLQNQKCAWINSKCGPESCYLYNDQQSCESSDFSESVCVWEQGSCVEMSCYRFTDKVACNSAPDKARCFWEDSTYSSYGGTCQMNYSAQGYLVMDQYSSSYELCMKYQSSKEDCINAGCSWGQGGSSYFFKTQDASAGQLFAWAFANIVFIMIILGVIGYGSQSKNTKIINLSIGFFVLEIFTRYIGFAMDLWGYKLLLPVIFIVGGIILIAGGWLINKWRRHLITQTQEGQEPQAQESNTQN